MNYAQLTRRRAIQTLLSTLGMSSLPAQGQSEAPPAADLANAFEFRDVARTKLADNVYSMISGTDRRGLERITLRPRLMVNVSELDLTTDLLGEKLFAPILIGPVANLQSYHPEGEVGMVRGAGASKSLMVISAKSDRKLQEITTEAKGPLWFQSYPDADMAVTISAVRAAVESGCKAICLTVGVRPQGNSRMDWATVDRVKKSVKAPLLLKGVMSPEEATVAVSRGIDGIIVSNHGGMYASGLAEPIEVLPSIVEAVAGKAPVLVDGGFRRGTDILKAIALGARAVLLGRPAVWGLAAYGSEGVQAIMEMLQTELARNMALCGKPDLKAIDRSLVKVHHR